MVLTALLVKAAYDRYNSSSEEPDSNNNNIYNNSTTTERESPNNNSRRTNNNGSASNNNSSRRRRSPLLPRKLKSRRHHNNSHRTSNNNSRSSSNNGGTIKFTREDSFSILKSLNTPQPQDTTNNMRGAGNNHKGGKFTNNNNNNNSSSNNVGGSGGNNQSMRYTRHGNYVIDGKRGVLTLPPPNASHDDDNNQQKLLEGETETTITTTQQQEEEEGPLLIEDTNFGVECSPNKRGRKVVVAEESNQQQEQIVVVEEEETTFRNDVRNEWIDAIFGKDFYPVKSNEESDSNNNGGDIDIGVQQGVGMANIPHYVTYGAIVDPTTCNNNNAAGAGGSGAGGNSSGNIRSNQQQYESPSTPMSTPHKAVQRKTQSTPILLQDDGGVEDDPSIVTFQRGLSGTVNESGSGGYNTPMRNGGYPQQQYSHRSTASTTLTSIPSTPSNNSTTTTTTSNNNNNKLGITISRIPLGLYVQSVHISSEAYTAGISPGSILVNINGTLGLLGERSDRALERLWLYAGLLNSGGRGSGVGGGLENDVSKERNGIEIIEDQPSSNSSSSSPNNSNKNSGSNSGNNNDENLQVKRPIQLTLYKSGRLYTVILLSGNPLSGIDWAPCGNFALVQRVISGLAGSNAGVRRGTIVCGINGESLRTLDHVGVARLLRSKFMNGERMVIGLGYTPAASRSTFLEREDGGSGGGESGSSTGGRRSPIPSMTGGGNNGSSQQQQGSSHKKKTNMMMTMKKKKNHYENYASFRDVEVRSRPPEYSSAISDTFFACAGPSAMGTVMEDRNDSSTGIGVGGTLSSSSGRIVSHGDVHINSSNISSIIPDVAAYVAAGGILPPGGVFVAAANIAAYRHRAMLSSQASGISSGTGRRLQPPPSNFGPCPTLEPGQFLEKWNPFASLAQSLSYHAAGCCEMKYVEMGGPFENGVDAKDAAYSITECIKVMQEIARSSPMADVVFDGHLLQLLGVAISPTMANDEVVRSREVMFDVLIDVALTNISLCQRLVFLLRSFIGVLETQKAECSNETTVIALKLLRYAQRSLSGRMFDKSLNLEEGRQGSVGYPMSHESSSSNSMLQQYTQQQYASLAIPASESATSPLSLESPDGVDSLPILFGGQTSLGGSTSNENLHQDSNQSSKKKARSKKILKLFKKRSQKIPPATSTQPKSPERVPAKTFTFPSVFHKVHSRDTTKEPMSMSRQFENMAWILRQIDNTCSAIEKNLMKSFSQKVADWALWSSSKEDALASVTQSFRSDLRLMNNSNQSSSTVEEERFPILNPLDPSELLTSVDSYECFILPSAHFPLLLCFESQPNTMLPATMRSGRSRSEAICRDVVYRTKVEILGLSGTRAGKAFYVQGCVAGAIKETTASSKSLVFETKSNWGYPKTLSLKVSSSSGPEPTTLADDKNQNDVGCAFVDLSPIYRRVHEVYEGAYINVKSRIYTFDSAEEFDQHGEVEYRPRGAVELHLRVSAEILSEGERPQKSLLLYKHGDDLRQELLAIQFIERCNDILKASGLDLKLKTFRCLPVGAQKGFIEWVKGTVPLSELCKTSSSSQSGSNPESSIDSKHRSFTNLSDAPQPQRRSWCNYKSLRGLPQKSNGSIIENPIQDFLRSAAFDEAAPYFVKKDVMDTYVKSCAGYCVITYLLGVGDRHLDNILLHQNGHLLHCDYSFILGHDPKTYMPMRITEEMVRGFGGRDSDNFARFLSFTGAAFLTLRRHNNLRTLLSHIRLMVDANMVDVSLHQPPEEAILAMRGRFRLDLNDDDALSYIEEVVEKSITSKMWKAVDVIHSIGKNF